MSKEDQPEQPTMVHDCDPDSVAPNLIYDSVNLKVSSNLWSKDLPEDYREFFKCIDDEDDEDER